MTSFLDDFLLDLPPLDFGRRPLDPYAVASFRNYLRQILRTDSARIKHGESAACSAEAGSESIIAECHSKYSLEAANTVGAADVSRPLSPLVAHLVADLTDDEEELLRILGSGSTVKEAARELGLDYGACRVRLHRIRVRLRMAATTYAEGAGGSEKKILARFLRRIGNPIHIQQRAGNG